MSAPDRAVASPTDRAAPTFVSVVLPAYNEGPNLPGLLQQLTEALAGEADHELIVVDDGSADDTLAILRHLRASDPRIHFVSLSRNQGHQTALRAGLDVARGACVITMDADGQHPPTMVPQLLGLWRQGHDIVQTLRQEDTRLPWRKRLTSRLYYGLLRQIAEAEIPQGSADFRLLDRCVVTALRRHGEAEIFYRGLLPSLGFRTVHLPYEPAARQHGSSRYSAGRMVRLGVLGMTATSIRPLRLAVLLAALVGVFALLMALYAVIVFLMGGTVTGWTSLIVVISIIGAMQLFVLGIIGEYVGQSLREARRRPPYLVRESSLPADASSPALQDDR